MLVSVADPRHIELRELAAAIAVEAGDLAAAGRRDGGVQADTKSSPTDVVTQFDRAAEAHIVGRLRLARPCDGLVGEEGTRHAGTSGIDWLVDPIDGTTNFLYDLPGWAVSIAAADHAGTVAGAVYVPSVGELFVAARGAGAQLRNRWGERPLAPTGSTDLSTALVATGFAYQPARRGAHAQLIAAVIPRIRDIRRFGAASVDLCHVAAGRVDAYVESHLGPWDLAAGELIAREAGCRTGDLAGGAVRPDEVLVATPAIFDELGALLRSARDAAG